MSLPDWLTSTLACPRCKGPLDWRAAPHEARCPACRLGFPVRDGVPELVLEAARPLARDEPPPRAG